MVTSVIVGQSPSFNIKVSPSTVDLWPWTSSRVDGGSESFAYLFWSNIIDTFYLKAPLKTRKEAVMMSKINKTWFNHVNKNWNIENFSI